MYSPVLSTMIAGAFRDHAPAPREFSLLNLKSGQSLTIRYKSIGCSHHYSYRFVFTAREVVIYALDTPGKIGTPRKLGTHRLTDEERIAALGANWAGPAIGSATAEKTPRKEHEEDKALSHAGKLADPQILASVGIGQLLLDGSSQQSCAHDGAFADPNLFCEHEKDRWDLHRS